MGIRNRPDLLNEIGFKIWRRQCCWVVRNKQCDSVVGKKRCGLMVRMTYDLVVRNQLGSIVN